MRFVVIFFIFLCFLLNDVLCADINKADLLLQPKKDVLINKHAEYLNSGVDFSKIKTFLLDGKQVASSIIIDNGIIILNDSGELYYINDQNPKDILWHLSLTNAPKIYSGGLAYSFNKLLYTKGVILCIVDNVLYGIDVSHSNIIWKQVLRNIVDGNPVIINDGKNVAVLTADNYLFVFNINDGKLLWSYQGVSSDIKKMSSLSPAFNVKNNILTLLLPNGNVVALNSYNGSKIWDLVLSKNNLSIVDSISITPVTSEDELLIVNHDQDLVDINVLSGQINWVEKLNVKVVSPIINENVFIITNDDVLIAFNIKNKAIMWKCNLLNKIQKNIGITKRNKWFPPILASDSIWVLNDNGFLLKINSISGVIEKINNVPRSSYHMPMIDNLSMYFITKEQKLAVIS